MLNLTEKLLLKNEILKSIPLTGIDTRNLAYLLLKKLSPSIIPSLNIYHIFGMLSYILRTTNHKLDPRQIGSSRII